MVDRKDIMTNIITQGFVGSKLTLLGEHEAAKTNQTVIDAARNNRTGAFVPGEEKMLTGMAQAIRELRVEMRPDGRPKLREGITLTQIEISMAEMEKNNPTLRSTMETWAANTNVTADEVKEITLKAYQNKNSTTLVNDLKADMDRMAAATAAPAIVAGNNPPPQPIIAAATPTPEPEEERIVLPERLTVNSPEFTAITGIVSKLTEDVFPGDQGGTNKTTFLRKLNSDAAYRQSIVDAYNADPEIRKTYQDLMDLAARGARETNPDGSPKEMSATVRGALQGPMGKILNDPTKLHNKDFLHTEIDPLIANANNPMMAMFGKAFDFIKGFFGNFLQSLGFTGPEKWHQLGGGFMDMFKGGMGKLGDMFGFDGAAIAGNAGGGLLGDFMGGIQRAFGMESATRTLLHADGAPPVEYVFLKNGQNVGHGYLLEPLKDEAGNNIRDTQYAKNIDENGRGRNFTTIPDNDGLIPKSQWDAQEAQRRLQQQGQQAGLNNAAPAAGPGGGGGIS